MENTKQQEYETLIKEIYEYYWNKKQILADPAMCGPLNAPLMVIGINGNIPRKDAGAGNQIWNAPFFISDNRLNYDKLSHYNRDFYMPFFLGYKSSEEIESGLNRDYANQLEAMKNFKASGKKYDKMGPYLLKLFGNSESTNNENLKKMIRTCIFYSNAIKEPTNKAKEIDPKSWEDKKGIEFLKSEIKLINPRIILCLGKDLYDIRTNYFSGENEIVAIEDNPHDFPNYYIQYVDFNECGFKERHVFFMYHYHRVQFFPSEQNKRYYRKFVELQEKRNLNIVRILNDFLTNKEFVY